MSCPRNEHEAGARQVVHRLDFALEITRHLDDTLATIVASAPEIPTQYLDSILTVAATIGGESVRGADPVADLSAAADLAGELNTLLAAAGRQSSYDPDLGSRIAGMRLGNLGNRLDQLLERACAAPRDPAVALGAARVRLLVQAFGCDLAECRYIAAEHCGHHTAEGKGVAERHARWGTMWWAQAVAADAIAMCSRVLPADERARFCEEQCANLTFAQTAWEWIAYLMGQVLLLPSTVWTHHDEQRRGSSS